MVRHINVAFEDYEIDKLEQLKDKTSWHDFILTLIKEQDEHQ